MSVPNSKDFSWGFWGVLIGLAIIIGGLEVYISFRVTDQVNALLNEKNEEAGDSNQQHLTQKNTPRKVRINRKLIELVFKEGENLYKEAHESILGEIHQDFEQLRDGSDQVVAMWADWYFSVTGEYARLFKLVSGDATVYMTEQVEERLIKPLHAGEKLLALEERVQEKFNKAHIKAYAAINNKMKEVLTEAKSKGEVVPEDLEYFKNQEDAMNKLQAFSSFSKIALTTKLLSFSGGAIALKAGAKGAKVLAAKGAAKGGLKAGQVAGKKAVVSGVLKGSAKITQAVVAKVASKGLIKSAVALWSKLLIKFGMKTVAKGGGALTAGATGALSCAPLGPIAFACGAGAAIITWFAVDKVIVEVDEYLNRDEFESDLRRDLRQTWDEVERDMVYKVDAHFQKTLSLMRSKETTLPKIKKKTRLIDELPINR